MSKRVTKWELNILGSAIRNNQRQLRKDVFWAIFPIAVLTIGLFVLAYVVSEFDEWLGSVVIVLLVVAGSQLFNRVTKTKAMLDKANKYKKDKEYVQ